LSGTPIYATETPKVDLKVWCFVNSISKFVSNFKVYCGKNPIVEEDGQAPRGLGERQD